MSLTRLFHFATTAWMPPARLFHFEMAAWTAPAKLFHSATALLDRAGPLFQPAKPDPNRQDRSAWLKSDGYCREVCDVDAALAVAAPIAVDPLMASADLVVGEQHPGHSRPCPTRQRRTQSSPEHLQAAIDPHPPDRQRPNRPPLPRNRTDGGDKAPVPTLGI